MDNPNQKPVKVKFIYRGRDLWRRQFPNQNQVWNNCHFVFDREERNYDWLVVFDDLNSQTINGKYIFTEELACPAQNTLFITREPASVAAYSSIFLKQFGYVLTGQEDWAIRHPGKIYSQPALNWFYGYDLKKKRSLDYDHMVANPPEEKTNIISTVCSAKAQKHTLHHKRVQFVEQIEKSLPELARFGKGVREIDDKAEALDPFRYHIAIENHIAPHWWTEKLSDAFLGLTLPFYCGAPNTADYFPKESFIPIDIRDAKGSLKIIREAIENNEYEKRLPAIQEARRLVLEKYNMFAVLSGLIEARHAPNAKPIKNLKIYGKHALRKNPCNAIAIGFEKLKLRWLSAQHKNDF